MLNDVPTATVTITAAPGDSQIDISEGPGNSLDLFFTTSDWDTAQTVTVTAYDDTVYEGGPEGAPHITTISHSSPNAGYEDISSVDVSVVDDDLGCGDWGYYDTDLNQDCYVNLEDFAMFAINWLESD